MCIKKRDSPISSMLKVVTAYKVDEILREHLLRGDFGDFYRWKRLIKKIVWDNEITKWKLSCILYSKFDVYRNCVCHMGMHPWWQLARHKPNLTNLVSGVLAVLQGGQPRGMQCNFDSKARKLCDTAQRDNAQHVLFICPGLETVRSRAWDSLLRSMPDPLVVELRNSNIKTKCEILSGLRCRFVSEWTEIYVNVGKIIRIIQKLIRWHWTISFGYHMNELWKRGFASSHYVYTACNVGHIILFLLCVIP